MRRGINLAQSSATTRGGGKKAANVQDIPYGDICGKCGAIRIDQQIGLEPTPEAFVAKMVEVFREVRRVLRKDGVLFLNLGDSYAMSTKGSSGKGEKQKTNAGTILLDRCWKIPTGLKPKDLVGIPWMVAFALRADGWWLRQEIIWAKPNPMPESVTDRCTKAHEHVFLLTKSERYFYDAEAIGEPATYASEVRVATPKNLTGLGLKPTRAYGYKLDGNRNKRSVWTIATAQVQENPLWQCSQYRWRRRSARTRTDWPGRS